MIAACPTFRPDAQMVFTLPHYSSIRSTTAVGRRHVEGYCCETAPAAVPPLKLCSMTNVNGPAKIPCPLNLPPP
jgi:hypothetical protein